MDVNLYAISATPSNQKVSPGSKVTYFCHQTYATISSPDAPKDQFQWYCINDAEAAAKRGQAVRVPGPAGCFWKDATWAFPGMHRIQCHVTFADGGKHVYEYPQCVEPVQAILGQELALAKEKGLRRPETEANVLARYIGIQEEILKQNPIQDGGKKAEFDQFLGHLKAYQDKLQRLLAETDGCVRFPIAAAHLMVEKQEKNALKVFVANKEGGKEWHLVDWTDPTNRTRTGKHDGSGETPREGIQSVIDTWNHGFCGNRYPPGMMMYEVPDSLVPGGMSGQFVTTGDNVLDEIVNVLNWIGMAAGVAAMVITLIAPVPGSQAVSFLIWTSIFASTAAATTNIAERYREGFSNFHDDAFDTLTIVGNLFMGTGAWLRGAPVLYQTKAGGAVLKGAFIGNIAGTTVQGVILGHDYLEEFDGIMADTSLMPNERTNKLLAFFGRVAGTTALTIVSLKGTAKDLENLNQRPKYAPSEWKETAADKLKRLQNPKETTPVDLTTKPPMEGHTDNGKSTTTVQTKPGRAPLPGSGATSGGGGNQRIVSIFVVEGRGNFEEFKVEYETKKTHPYLYTGHVGFSLDQGRKRIWGFGPHSDLNPIELLTELRANKSFPGKLTNDRYFFEIAAGESSRLNRSGEPMSVLQLDIPVSETKFQEIQERLNAIPKEAPLPEVQYSFPPFQPGGANCATFPEKVGIVMKVNSGKVNELAASIKAEEGLKTWKPNQ